MSAIMSTASVIGSLFFTPFLMLLLCIIFLASIGKSIGVRRLYIKLLLIIFEYGRANIETAQQRIRPNDESDEDEGYSEELPPDKTSEVASPPPVNGIKKNGVLSPTNGNSLISRDDKLILVPEPPSSTGKVDEKEKVEDAKLSDDESKLTDTRFELSNCLEYIKAGMEAIIEDQVTSRFEAEDLKNWNLLTRTNRRYEFISWKLTVIWMCGFIIRYCFLFPLRVIICFCGVLYLVVTTWFLGLMPDCFIRWYLIDKTYKIAFRIMVRSLSGVVTFYNKHNRPRNASVCVANHTSTIDVIILSTDNSYSLIGQRHGGFLGILQRAVARASPHIWFERSEVKDRHAVALRLKEHVSNPNNPPILIFPEGTCINNTSVMQFKKGSFEVGSIIYPVAIKYDARFGDAFWNSSRYSMMQYLYCMMTSWAIVCEVWYLPPMTKGENESAIDFANRVKSVIAKQGGLVDLVWDGQLKRMKPKKEWKERQQEEFSKRLKIE